jgi:hypothetical protein
MSRERGSTGARRLGTCSVQVLQGFGFATQLRSRGRCAETPLHGDRSDRMRQGADGATVQGPLPCGGAA